MKVVGIEMVDYVSRQTGNVVKGVKLHCTEEFQRDNCSGLEVFTPFYVSSTSDGYNQLIGTVKVGSEITLSYNRWGRIQDVHVIK